MASRTSLMAVAAASLLLSACGDDQVATYRVPKEKDAELPMAAAAEAGSQPDAGAPAAAGPSMADTAVPTA